MRESSRSSPWSWFVAILFLVSLSLPAFGVELDVAVGIGGHVVRWSYAPVRVRIEGLTQPIDGRIRLVQLIGNPAENPARVDGFIYVGPLSDRTYEATVPIYDPLNPVRIDVEDGEGRVIASSKLDLRLKRRMGAFPAVCGVSISPADDAVFIDHSELPADWWGYDPVRTLWIGGAGATEDEWTTIGEWVTAGGSLVLSTGSDFYRFDTPTVRELIPIGSPRLETAPDGTEYLTGDAKEGGRIALLRDGIPLLHVRRYGAGTVALVTVRAEEVSDEELAGIVARVPSARALYAAPLAEEILREMRVDRPNYLTSVFLVVLVSAAFVTFARLQERNPRLATGFILTGIVILTVSSGLYINRTKHPASVYSVNLELSVETSFGIKSVWQALYAAQPGRVALEQDEGSFPIESGILSLAEASFDAESEPCETRIELLSQERRDLAYYGRSSSSIAFAVDGGSVTVTNLSGEPIDSGLIAIDRLAYPIGPLPPGTETIELAGGRDLGVYGSGNLPLDLAVRRFEGILGLGSGTWLIALQEEERIEDQGGSAKKVRDVRIRFIAGGDDGEG